MKNFKIIVLNLVTIAILFFMFYTRIRPGPAKPKAEIAIRQMQYVRSAIAAYIYNTDRLPSRLEDLIVCPEELENLWKGPYLKENQLYDPWENKFILEYGYRLQSFGADGIKGGTKENADIEKFTGLIKNENQGDSGTN